MERYKICPVCGARNSSAMPECTECEADLLGVAITVDREPAVPDGIQEPANRQETLFRICDCGMQNPASARKCAGCGEDISDIMPTAAKKEPVWQLLAEPEGYIYGNTD